ncbi:O-antigen ligase family protein [Arthrobacter sp. H35-D1]|uniref:O-antigen ligase family protein n=1 Tax=Arthrobacter sp. H35-D1 TaxID=3046202 RepID=UPI0024B9EF0B|nr:O-antigen ligase family protein [Arthrobacter sp. H35-D1]MDJ0312313.1 O-antigen ligase family protein [Arthrobacter sp. H35-D1]
MTYHEFVCIDENRRDDEQTWTMGGIVIVAGKAADGFDSARIFTPRPSQANGEEPPWLLRFTAFAIFAFPANMVLKPLGAAGHVAMLLSLLLFVFWGVSLLLGLHKSALFRHPGRIALGMMLLATCITYVMLFSDFSGTSTIAGRASADRWVLLMAGSAGLILVTAEVVKTTDHAMVLVRALLRGAFFCCLLAAVQFVTRTNPMETIQEFMIGFTDNGGNTTFQLRGGLMRVAGTTFTPIELGVVASMVLPISVWRCMFDRVGRKWMHWCITGSLVFAIAATISRSGMISATVAVLVSVFFLPKIGRQWALLVIPAAVTGLFVAVPGLMATLLGATTVSSDDPSISTRLNNYPRVEAMFLERPIGGTGPGTYMPENALELLDNQYLHTAVEMGTIGAIAVFVYLTFPGLTTLQAARHAADPSLRCLAGAVAGAALVAAPASATFDSLSFPVFALLYPLIVGLGGAVWIMVKSESAQFQGLGMLTVDQASNRSIRSKE